MSMVMSLVERRSCIITRPRVTDPPALAMMAMRPVVVNRYNAITDYLRGMQEPSASARLNELICVPSECSEGPPFVMPMSTVLT